MPIPDELRTKKIDYKNKYKNLKRKLKLLIYENESYTEELRKAERQLLQVSRDKTYLLDRLLQYEKVESSTSGSEDTLSSDSEAETRKLETKKKKTNEANVSNELQNNCSSNSSRKKKSNTSAARSRSSSTGKGTKSQSTATQASGLITTSTMTSVTTSTMTTMTTPLIKNELSLSLGQSLATSSQSSKASVSSTSSMNSTIDGHMTSEELERHLESRRQPSALLMPEKTPLTVPVELFSNESSNGADDDNHGLRLMS